jgi:hypothetical protein
LFQNSFLEEEGAMRVVLTRLMLVAAIAAVTAPASAANGEAAAPAQARIPPPNLPLYCQRDSNAVQRFEGADFRAFYNGLRRKLGWPGRIEVINPEQADEYVVAGFAEERNDSFRAMRFFLHHHNDGLVL